MSANPEIPTGRAAKLCIDLCSGLGGFSRAFVDAGWEVVTVDTDSRFEPTLVADITTVEAATIEGLTQKRCFADYSKAVVLASPPCERFSIAMPRWPQKGIGKALQIVGACLELIIEIKPQYWLLENPKGRLRWFLGTPPNSVKLSDFGHRGAIQGGKLRRPLKPTDLWGNIPFQLIPASVQLEPRQNYFAGFGSEEKARRAEMPYGLSQAILEAVEAEA